MQVLNITQEQLTKAMPMTLDLIEWILNFQKQTKINIYFYIIIIQWSILN